MRQPTAADLDHLLAPHDTPCISLYQKTHRHYPGTQEDPIRFKNLLNHAREQAARQSADRDIGPLLAQMSKVAEGGRDFWHHQLEGLAIFCSPDFFLALQLQSPVEDSVTVADTFRTKPLVRVMQTTGRYQVLCFETHNVRLYEGNQYALDEVELRDVPTHVDQLQAEPHWAAHYLSGGGNTRRTKSPNEEGTKQVGLEANNDQEMVQFMRVVDRAIWENHSRLAGLPLILCAVEGYHPIFRRLTQNQNVLPQGIKLDPHHLPLERVRDEAWKIIEPLQQQRINQVVDAFRTAAAQNMGSDALERVTEAAAMGRVGTLLVDSQKHVTGRMDPITGRVEFGDNGQQPGMDDVLDETAERVLRTGGQVFVVPPDVMPTDSGIAAIYRY